MKIRKLTTLAVLSAGAAGVYLWTRTGAEDAGPAVRTALVTEGDVRETVRATGALEATTTVAVGTQVSGVVAWLGADFNSVVRTGQIIARLEPSLLASQVEQARANLARVNTDVRQREMTVADREMKQKRAQQLSERQLISESDLEEAQLAAAVAGMDLESTRAQVTQAEAALNQALVNLGHATIRAPIDGTVVQRSVDVGQTVAASLSSPTLFLIVGDLARMRVSAAVDESDVAKVAAGQRVAVTVDAFPGRRFTGTVAQVRLQPTVTSNVTTYTTIVDVNNDDLALKPGMTAAAEIEIASRTDVVRVPNAALRFRPTAEIFAALNQPEPSATARPAGDSGRAVHVSTREAEPGTPGQVWVQENGLLTRIDVRLGLADATNTELIGSTLEPGTSVVTGVALGASAPAPAASPNLFGNRGRGRS